MPAASEEAFTERKRAHTRRHKAYSVGVVKGSIVHGTWNARGNGALGPIQNPPGSLSPTIQMFSLHYANPCHKKRQFLLFLSDPNLGALTLAQQSPHAVPGGDSKSGAPEQAPCAIRNEPHRENLPRGMHSLLPASPQRYFPVWRLRSLLIPLHHSQSSSQTAPPAAWALQHLLSRGDPWHCHIPPAQTHLQFLHPWQEHHPVRNLPPLSRAAGLTWGQGRML